MAEQKENPTTCERCGAASEPGKPVNIYNPNTSGYPTKRVALCPACAKKDPKATLVRLSDSPASEDVPDIAPAVPDDPNVVETTEFAPKVPELNVATPAPLGDLGPVPPEVIKQKLAVQEKDHDTLMGRRQKLQAQLTQVAELLMIKRGAIAQLRDLLGNAKS